MRNNALRPILALSLAALLTACDGGKQTGVPDQPPLSEGGLVGARIGADFTLTGSNDQKVRWADFKGKWRLVYFGYTYCPDACPMDMTIIAQGLQKYAAEQPELAAQIQPIFITIDPERDTAARVGEFAAAFKPAVVGLTGTRAEIDATAKAFGIYHARGQDLPGGYLMDHSRGVNLFDPDGKPIAIIPIERGLKDGPADVAAELKKWVR